MKKRKFGKPLLCLNCGIKHSVIAASEMANKSGPAYDKWLETAGPQGRPRGKTDEE